MNCVVVGANRGIGLEFTKQLIEGGHKVAALCRNTSGELSALDCQVVEGVEVSDKTSLDLGAKSVNFENIDWLLHVSGILKSTSLSDFEENDIMEQLKINSLGPLLTVRAFLPKLGKNSKVGLLTSRMGSIADNDSGGAYGYRMSKAALNAAGKSLAMDLKDQGVSVFLLHPGWVRTEMTGNNGLIDTDESVKGLVKVMDEKSLANTGSFWHTNGEELPW